MTKLFHFNDFSDIESIFEEKSVKKLKIKKHTPPVEVIDIDGEDDITPLSAWFNEDDIISNGEEYNKRVDLKNNNSKNNDLKSVETKTFINQEVSTSISKTETNPAKERIHWIIITDVDLEYLEVKNGLPSIIEKTREEFIENGTKLYSLDILSGVWFSNLNKVKFFGLVFGKINARLRGNNLKYNYFYDSQNDTLNISLYHNHNLINKCAIVDVTQHSSPIQLFTILTFVSKNKIPLDLIKKV